jgi:predicted RNase H-like HicB family nuclease
MISSIKQNFMSKTKRETQKRVVLIYQIQQNLWTAQCLSLPGCSVSGETKGEVLIGIHREIRSYLEELRRRRLPIPEETFDAAVIEIY